MHNIIKNNLEQILKQDCTDFIKLQQLESMLKQTCDEFVKHLYQVGTIKFTDYSDAVYGKINFEKEFNQFLTTKLVTKCT